MGARPFGPALRLRPYVADGIIYAGQPVKLAATGKISAAAASDALCGVAATYASADGATVMVWDHPNQEFVMQSDDATIDAATDLNLNYNFVVGTHNTTYRRANVQIDGDTGATSSTLPLKVLRAVADVDSVLGSNVDCVFIINNHQYKGGTGTAGV